MTNTTTDTITVDLYERPSDGYGLADFTPDQGPICGDEHPHQDVVCTLQADHPGAHAAGNCDEIIAIWTGATVTPIIPT